MRKTQRRNVEMYSCEPFFVVAINLGLFMLYSSFAKRLKILFVPVASPKVFTTMRRILQKAEHVDFWIQSTHSQIVFRVPEITMKVRVCAWTMIFNEEQCIVVWIETLSMRSFSDIDHFPTVQASSLICSVRNPFFVVS